MANQWVAAAVVVLLAAGLAFEINSLRTDGGLPSPPPASRDVARKFAVAVTSFDYRRVDADLKRVLGLGTSGFEREFTAAMGSNFVEGIKANKRVSTGQIIFGPTAQRVAGGRAAFLVVVAQQIRSEGSNTAPQAVTTSMLLTVSTSKDPRVETVEVL